MSDTPQRATAAQMAQRSFSKRPTGRKRPIASSQPQSFPAPSQNGALFGSIQAPGDFNFSAGGPTISFGSNNSFGSNASNDDDERVGAEEERQRMNKRMSTGEDSVPLFASMPAEIEKGFASGTGASFSFGGSNNNNAQPATNGLFGSSNTQNSNSSFSFGGASSQPSSAPNPFASAPANSTNNIFSGFGQSTAQPQTTSSSFTFGQSTPAQPSSNPFSFGSTPQTTQPSTSFTFGSTSAAPKAPTSNIFGNTQAQPSQSSNLFGSSAQTPAATSNLFGSTASQAPATNNIFARASQSPAPENNLFGTPKASDAPAANNLFGNNPEPKAPESLNIFGAPKQQASAPTSNLFGNQTQSPAPAPTNLFGSPAPQSAPSTSNLFGNSSSTPAAATNIFGGFQQQQQSQPTRAVSAKTHGQSLFDRVQQSEDAAPAREATPTSTGGSLFDRVSTDVNGVSEKESLPQPENNTASTGGSLFGRVAKDTNEKPPSNNLFGSPSASTTSNSLFGQTAAKPTSTTNIFGGSNLSGSTDGLLGHLNQPVSGTPSETATTPATTSHPPATYKPPESSITQSKAGNTPNNVVQSIEPVEIDEARKAPPPFVPAAEISEEYMEPLVPTHFTPTQRKDFYVAYKMRALNKAMQKFFGSMIACDITEAVNYYNEQRELILTHGGTSIPGGSKRKAILEVQDVGPSKRSRADDAQTQRSQALEASFTKAQVPLEPSNNGPVQQAHSPPKSQPFMNGSTTPKAALPSYGLTPASASPTKSKRKAEYQITDQDPEGKLHQERQMKTPNFNGSVGSETSNIFKNILDSPSPSRASSSPAKKVHSLGPAESTGKEDAPRANPFAALSVPASTAQSASTTSSKPASNMFAPKVAPVTEKQSTTLSAGQPIKPPSFGSGPVNFLAQFSKKAEDSEAELMQKAKDEDMDSDDDEAEWEATYKEKRKAELKAIADATQSKRASFVAGKGFSFNASSTDSEEKPAESSAKSLFGQPSSAATSTSKSSFGQTPTPNTTSNMFGSVNGSRESTPGGSVLDSHTSGKAVSFGSNIFGHLSDAGSPANSKDGHDSDSDTESNPESDSENKDPTFKPADPGTEASSGPTTPVEKTGVGIASAKKSTAFSFGAQPQNATQTPKSLFGPTSGQPSTGLFGSVSGSVPGTTTPGGSIFDRISKDNEGNPIRHVSAEEKENTQPNATTIFGSSNDSFGASTTAPTDVSPPKSLFASTDKTWKPDSPIRFGSATTNGTPAAATPTVSVTDASASKSNPFSGLFGNSTTPKPATPTSGGLFGASKPATSTGAVGFSFGGPSSTTSSLFPSAVASATTSRATSPGQITDGDSAAEGSNDPDAEHHEQIDLTKGGPGEENEQCVHEVRAKALKYVPDSDSGSPWVTKGLGPLRILKHKDTKSARVLLRADPSGTIVINKGILAGVDYTASGKTLKFLAASDSGSGLETWMLQVKTPESAKELATVLEANKSSS